MVAGCGASPGIEAIAEDARPETVEVTVEKTLPATDMAEKGLLSFCLALSLVSFAFCLAWYSALILSISCWLTFSGSLSAVAARVGGATVLAGEDTGVETWVAK